MYTLFCHSKTLSFKTRNEKKIKITYMYINIYKCKLNINTINLETDHCNNSDLMRLSIN